MDIKKIVNNKIKEMLTGGEIKKRIEDDIEKSIIAAIDSKLSGYSFKDGIEKQLSEYIDPVLKEINLSGYGEIVKQRFQAIVEGVLEKDLSDKVEKFYSELFTPSTEPIKLSDFLEVVKDTYRDEGEYQGHYYLKIEYNDAHEWWEIGFQKDEPYGSSNRIRDYKNHITLSQQKDNENTDIYWLLSVDIDRCGFSISDKKISHIGSLDKAERMLLNAYFNKIDIIMDVTDVSDVDTEWYDD